MSLLATRLAEVVANSPIDSNEHRASHYGAFDMFNGMQGMVSPELEAKAQAALGLDLKIPVINHDAGIAISNDFPLVIADSENTSAQHLVVFATYSFGFTMQPAIYGNNHIAAQTDFTRKLEKYTNALGAQLDTDAIAALNAAKSQVFKDTLGYTVTGNVLQAGYDKRTEILGDVEAIMEANDHFGTVHVLGNTGMKSVINGLQKEGLYNATNNQLEYDNKVIHYSSRLLNEAADYANLIAVEEGSLGMLMQFESEVERNATLADGTTWSKEILPGLNIPIGTYYYEKAVDGTGNAAATADQTRVVKQHFGFAANVAFIVPYNSDPATIAEPIVKAAILKEV